MCPNHWYRPDDDSMTPDISIKVKIATNISLVTATTTQLTWETWLYDTHGMISVPYDWRLTCMVKGKYLVHTACNFASNSTGIRWIGIYKNGNSQVFTSNNATVGTGTHLQAAIILDLDVNDYVHVKAHQTSGGNLDLKANNSYFTAHLLSLG